MITFIAILLGYACGSLPFAVLVSRALKLEDPRTYGSGNPGATNVLRSGSKKAAAATLLLDAFKGWFPVWLLAAAGAAYGVEPLQLALAGLAAFLGHVFPITLAFKGGKGVATALGVLLAFGWKIALGCLATWIAVALITRYSSGAAIAAAIAAPIVSFLTGAPAAITLAAGVMSIILIWRHTANIKRLLAGTESRIGAKKNSN
jgi:glycerol-3-phosphate acyltransferase PlsY